MSYAIVQESIDIFLRKILQLMSFGLERNFTNLSLKVSSSLLDGNLWLYIEAIPLFEF